MKSQFVWGLYSIGTVEHTSDKMAAAVCTFRLYNRRRGCTPPLFYNGNAPQCTGQLEDGYVCKPACTLSAQVPTIETPKYFTCGKYAMWDDADRVADFMIPTCGTAQSPQHTVSVTIEYGTSSECAAYKPTLITLVQKSLTDLNNATNYGLCKVSNGGSDALCSGASLAVDCTPYNMASVQFSLKYLSGEVTYGGLQMSPQNVLKIAMRDQATFTYLGNAIPFFPSLNISTSLMCSTGHQLIGDKCVLCGDGYYYNSGTLKCLGCDVGQYRTVQVYTNPLSSCENCSGSGTTDNTGTPASTYCHNKCYLGQFYNSTISECMSCDYGEYSNSIGASICSPCGMDKTTNQTGSIYSNSCIAIVTPTQGPILEPDFGASTSDAKLSGGAIAAIVIGVLLAVFIIVGLIILCVTKRLPCMREDIRVEPEQKSPWKKVNRYGEMDLKFVNYRLSDIRESKQLDRLPVYSEEKTPDDTISTQYDINVHVPVFLEKLDGIITNKRTFISSGKASDTASELDRTLERPISQGAISTASLNGSARFSITAPQDHRSMSGHSRSERLSAKNVRRNKQGRPSADLSPHLPQRTLTPISRHRELPEMHSSQYIRPLPFFKRPEVTPQYYQEFLEPSPRPVRARPSEQGTTTPTTSQVGSDKILLDSDEDLR